MSKILVVSIERTKPRRVKRIHTPRFFRFTLFIQQPPRFLHAHPRWNVNRSEQAAILDTDPRRRMSLPRVVPIRPFEVIPRPRHVVFFSNNPSYRGETLGSYSLVLNTILNFDSLNAGRKLPEK